MAILVSLQAFAALPAQQRENKQQRQATGKRWRQAAAHLVQGLLDVHGFVEPRNAALLADRAIADAVGGEGEPLREAWQQVLEVGDRPDQSKPQLGKAGNLACGLHGARPVTYAAGWRTRRRKHAEACFPAAQNATKLEIVRAPLPMLAVQLFISTSGTFRDR